MPQNNIHILSTKELDEALVAEARARHIQVDISPFIKIEAIRNIHVQQEIETALLSSLAVIFTSVNAVEAVAAESHGQLPAWKIYCIGYATKKAVEQHFGQDLIVGVAVDAETLADLIIEDAEDDQLTFFCGDRHRGELPEKLRENGVELTEIIVYQTIPILHLIEKNYDGILFFSPSAVVSFFQMNKTNKHTVLFAIGNTTANEIKKYSDNKIVVSDEPMKRSLVEKAIAYFEETTFTTKN